MDSFDADGDGGVFLPTVSGGHDSQQASSCGCALVLQEQTELLRQRIFNAVSTELDIYDQFMNSILMNGVQSGIDEANEGGANDAVEMDEATDSVPAREEGYDTIDAVLNEMLRTSVDILLSFIDELKT